MKIIEHRMPLMDFGAPSPIILSSDVDLVILFFLDIDQEFDADWKSKGAEICKIRFRGALKHIFGVPGHETFAGHPYYTLGLRSFNFYELIGSDLIAQHKEIAKIHPHYDQDKYNEFRHFVITFHDNMFECIASDFEINVENVIVYEKTQEMLKELTKFHQ